MSPVHNSPFPALSSAGCSSPSCILEVALEYEADRFMESSVDPATGERAPRTVTLAQDIEIHRTGVMRLNTAIASRPPFFSPSREAVITAHAESPIVMYQLDEGPMLESNSTLHAVPGTAAQYKHVLTFQNLTEGRHVVRLRSVWESPTEHDWMWTYAEWTVDVSAPETGALHISTGSVEQIQQDDGFARRLTGWDGADVSFRVFGDNNDVWRAYWRITAPQVICGQEKFAPDSAEWVDRHSAWERLPVSERLSATARQDAAGLPVRFSIVPPPSFQGLFVVEVAVRDEAGNEVVLAAEAGAWCPAHNFGELGPLKILDRYSEDLRSVTTFHANNWVNGGTEGEPSLVRFKYPDEGSDVDVLPRP